MSKAQIHKLEVVYRLAHPDPAEVTDVTLKLDRAFDILFDEIQRRRDLRKKCTQSDIDN